MGRPSASPENRAFAVFLAHAVTKKSTSRFDFVARSGPLSLFSALAKMFPAYARTEDGQGFRDGVSEVQLNKELQKNGFARIRDRRSCATRKADDPTGAGMYLFSQLQWKDPSDPEDYEALVHKYHEMVEKFPLILLSCKLEKYLRVVTEFQKEWAVCAEAMNLEAEAENETQSAQRSTSVSPPVHGTQPKKFLADIRSLTSSTFFRAPSSSSAAPASPPLPMTANAGALNPSASPLVFLNPGMQTTANNLSALQTQLTSSLLAVTLAKQQLQTEHYNGQKVAPFNGGLPLQRQVVTEAYPLAPFGGLVFPMHMS
eukprot:CAMPEP_0196719664 /NCGR_PEP_ID=MMETSP1091-20130531/2597_1 /TAXON_ID=302021 /ORGANISM="Rhodomonas sp., Strain CCMP768" /LENGTH=314 /DNA_ID=CAMNT_0042060687 /DNA_START=30 /DNA_END=974 /DNA_ORIENTATION=+